MRLHRLLGLLSVSILLLPQVASAQRQRARTGGAVRQAQAAPSPTRAGAARPQLPRSEEAELAREREIVRRHLTARRTAVRARGQIFRTIAVDRRFSGEYVLMRDQNVTAFLDITDPQHPAFDPRRESGEEELELIPIARRAHILVVPNRAREHLTGSLGATISSADLKETLEVVKSAEALAARLGIQNAKIFVNPESRVAIGYLHVHIIGERPGTRPYPPALK